MRILLLAGGDSSEREVSLTTGGAIHESLKRQGHQVLAMDPASGRSLLDNEGKFLTTGKSKPAESAVLFAPLVSSLGGGECRDIDLVFLALHGGTGENGSIQNLLELAGQKFTGSSMCASAIAMNKAVSKRLFHSVGVMTPEWELYLLEENSAAEISREMTESFDLPIIVKPNAGGSTVGVTKVTTQDQLPGALKRAAEEGREVLVEQFIGGREVTVAVLDGHAFPVVEIRPVNELYDYESKYTTGKSEYTAPAKIPNDISRRIRSAAMSVYEVIGASGIARVDFILAESEEFYCLELNSLPGMTDLSLVPMAARCEGIEFDQLIEKMIQSALK